MDAIFTTEQNRTLFLYSFEHRLYLRTVQSERISRPILLCNNYQDGLSGISYNKALYYSYLSHDDSLLVRNLAEPTPVFRLDGTSIVSYSAPHLVVFADRLLFFYIEKSKDSYSLKSRALFSEIQPESLPDCFSDAPTLHILSADPYLYVLLSAADTSKLFRYNTDLRTELLSTGEDLLCELTPLFEQKHKQLQQKLETSSHLFVQQSKLLHEKEQEASDAKLQLAAKEQELRSLRQALAETEEKAHHTELLLERAKAQYTELMTVAEQYRNEAMKWYGKFTDKR